MSSSWGLLTYLRPIPIPQQLRGTFGCSSSPTTRRYHVLPSSSIVIPSLLFHIPTPCLVFRLYLSSFFLSPDSTIQPSLLHLVPACHLLGLLSPNDESSSRFLETTIFTAAIMLVLSVVFCSSHLLERSYTLLPCYDIGNQR